MESIVLNEDGFYDIYPLMHVPFWYQRWFLVTGAVVATVIVCVGIGMLIRYRWRKKVAPPAWKVALSKLAAISADEALSDQKLRDTYAFMTEIIKEYIENRFALSLRHLTDCEVNEILIHADLEGISKKEMAHLFQVASGIKFSPTGASAASLKKDVGDVRAFIEATRVTPVSKAL